jgi:hypothetical protein
VLDRKEVRVGSIWLWANQVNKSEVKKMRFLVVMGVLILTLTVASVSFAGVPSASTSTVERAGQGTPACNPNTAVVCPKGDWGSVLVTVTVRNVYGDPLPGKTVNCQAVPVTGTFCFCAGQTPQTGVTDINGQIQFTFIKFGGCGDLKFTADSDGVFFNASPNIYIASPDNNGSCSVTGTDLTIFAGGYGGTSPCHDYDCSGTVTGTDLTFFAAHYGHICP